MSNKLRSMIAAIIRGAPGLIEDDPEGNFYRSFYYMTPGEQLEFGYVESWKYLIIPFSTWAWTYKVGGDAHYPYAGLSEEFRIPFEEWLNNAAPEIQTYFLFHLDIFN
jgi:hypothetical protein